MKWPSLRAKDCRSQPLKKAAPSASFGIVREALHSPLQLVVCFYFTSVAFSLFIIRQISLTGESSISVSALIVVLYG